MNVIFPQSFDILDVFHPEYLDWRQVRLSLHDSQDPGARDAREDTRPLEDARAHEMHLHIFIPNKADGRGGAELITCPATQPVINDLIWQVLWPLLENDPEGALVAEEPISETCTPSLPEKEPSDGFLVTFQLPPGLARVLGRTSHHGLMTLHEAARDAAAHLARRRRTGPTM